MGIPVANILKVLEIPLAEKWGYIMGTSGQTWTEAKQNDIVRKYNSDPAKYANYELAAKKGSKWIGHKVSDCSGLILWALIQNGSKCPHGSNSIWKQSLSSKGPIEKNSEIAPGEVVFKLRNGNDYYHVGFYIGNGYVIEAQGTNTGVVRSKLSSWTHHGRLKAVDYSLVPATQTDLGGVDISMGEYKVTAQNGKTVRIRKGPSTNANITYEVPVGSDVKVLASSEGWAKVQYVVEGYMMTDYLIKK